MAISEDDLIARVQGKQCQHAFGELVKMYQSDVRQLLRKLTGGDMATADDLAQDTFVKAFKGVKNFRKEAGFKTWLFRIAWNVYRDYYRSTKRRPVDYVEEVPESEVESDFNAPMKSKALEAALSTLSSDQRMAIYLCLQQEMTQQEASTIMGLPLGTVKSHVNRGKAKLASLLAGWQREGEYG
jgi:RNA polymerase sigma-70 factor (ECF subfamily)